MSKEKKNLHDAQLKGKRVLMRVDLNVPLKQDLSIADDTRLQACLPTLKHILKEGGSIVLLAHLGRPKGKKVDSLSTQLVLKRLSKLLGYPVLFCADCIGEEVQEMKQNLKPGQILLLENVRFYPAEEDPTQDPTFSEQLARHCDLYINDSFSTSHRAHVSSCKITSHFPKLSFMGLNLAQEVKYLKDQLLDPKRPFFALIGGAKISSKIGVLLSLIEHVDGLIIGGAMAHTFFKAQGLQIGKSLNEPEYETQAKKIMDLCKQKKIKLLLPVDLVVTPKVEENSPYHTVKVEDIPPNEIGVDVGPQTIAAYKELLSTAKTVFWNGPLGVCEIASFSKGTEEVAKLLGRLEATTIVGGGDSTAALKKLKLDQKITYISTGGGASLEYIEKGTLPGIEALSDKG